jgi:uncharacterized protein
MVDAGYPSERTRVRRQPHRGRYDAATVCEVLDAALIAHVAFVDGQQPFCIPMLQARIGDLVYIHGSIASRSVRVLGSGCQACLTVTMLDGLVLARSAFEHSANYRAAVVLGRFRPVDDASEKVRALAAFTDKMVSGRWEEVRQPSAKELKATAILALPLGEASVKVRSGPPSDDNSVDARRDTWAGVLPLETSFGTPVPSPGLRPGIPLPASVRRSRLNDHTGAPPSTSA